MDVPKHNDKNYRAIPYGKAASDIRLPPDWRKYVGNLSNFVTQKNGDSLGEGMGGQPLTITTVPPRPPSGKNDPTGHTEFLSLSEATRSKVFNYPGFPRPVNTPKVPKFEIREAPGKGRGVYATCDLYPGDLIWAERPFMVGTAALNLAKGLSFGEHHTQPQKDALLLYAAEHIVAAIVNRMTPERKARFMSLANIHKEDGSGPCTGIVRTNQLGIRLVEGKPGPDPATDPRRLYTAVGDTLSLANHSCIPNIKNSFDVASFSLETYAWATIKKGDELVWSYVGQAWPAAQRQKELAPYGFRCECRLCTDPQTDTLWKSLGNRSYMLVGFFMTNLLREDFDDPFYKKSPAEQEAKLRDYKNMILSLKDLLRESDSYGFIGPLSLLCLMHELYKRVGNETKRRGYVNLVVRWTKCHDIESRPYL